MRPLALSRDAARSIDRRAIDEYGMTGLVLMENAGRGVVDKLFQFGIIGPVVVACGKGNNAGDGFVIARHLDLRCVPVRELFWGEPDELPHDARANFDILSKSDVPIEELGADYGELRVEAALAGAAHLVDALLGTGARGAARPPLDRVIRRLNAHKAPKIAVDLPSGLDCDTGAAADPTIRARHTCTFVAPKLGFLAPGAETYTGVVHVLDIGAPRKLVDDVMRAL